MFLVSLITALGGTHSKRGNRKSAKADRKTQLRVQLTNLVEGMVPNSDSMECETSPCSKASTSSPAPVQTDNIAPPADHITIGINEVTKKLESQLKSIRKSVTVTTPSHANPTVSPDVSSIAVVFVCRADVNPPILLDHILHLVAGCNSTRPTSESTHQPVKLVVLPKGSESALAQALGLRRAAIIAIHNNAPCLPVFHDMLQSVPVINAPWLVPPNQPNSSKCLIPTHIKQLRTTAPNNMKAAKEQRAKARAAAKKNSAKPKIKKRVVLTTAAPDT